MMGYIDYKKNRNKIVNESKTFQQLSIGLSYVESIFNIEDRLKRYKYAHGDLNDNEKKELMNYFNIPEGAFLIGGEIHSIIDNIFQKTGEIELFKIMDQIQIIKRRNYENI